MSLETSGGNKLAEAPKDKKAKSKQASQEEEILHIVRILNTDLDGHKQVQMAITGINGVGRRAAMIFVNKSGVDPHAILGKLPEAKINDLKAAVEVGGENMPPWMRNRRKDIGTGTDRHVLAMDLTMINREDLDLMKKMRSYKGIRHERGLRVRGQRTRSTGRTGAIVGVSRKKEGAAPVAKPAAAPAGK